MPLHSGRSGCQASRVCGLDPSKIPRYQRKVRLRSKQGLPEGMTRSSKLAEVSARWRASRTRRAGSTLPSFDPGRASDAAAQHGPVCCLDKPHARQASVISPLWVTWPVPVSDAAAKPQAVRIVLPPLLSTVAKWHRCVWPSVFRSPRPPLKKLIGSPEALVSQLS